MDRLREIGIISILTIIFEFTMGFIASLISSQGFIVIVKAFLIIIFVFILIIIFKWLYYKKRRRSWIESKDAPQYRALIAAVSVQKSITPAEIAIQHHLPKLTHCWLLVTDQAKENFDMIEKKYSRKPQDKERYKNDDGHEIIFERRHLGDPYNIKEIFNIVNNIFADAKSRGIDEKEIITDYTGGTSSVTAGMVLATALSNNRSLELLSPNEIDQERGTPIISKGFKPIDINLRLPGE